MPPTQLRQRPILTLPQILLLFALIGALIIALDLNRREQAGRLAGVGEEELQAQLDIEATRYVELQATRAYVESEDYVVDYARNEAGFVMPGERRVVPLFIEATPVVITDAAATPDAAYYARPWQAWMRLLTDYPLPLE
jgi:cell division protein FtsB